MSPKVAPKMPQKAAPKTKLLAKKPAPKAQAKGPSKPQPALAKQASAKQPPAKAKDEKTVALAASAPGVEPGVDAEELEEAEAERAASGGGGNAAALAAAANGTTEMSASFKNFRHHPDMENFYRFIYENDLRHEALTIIDQIQLEKQVRRAAKAGKLSAH